jgi:hypothetical protein
MFMRKDTTMGLTRLIRRATATAALALAAAGAWTAPAAATAAEPLPDTIVEQPFAADSGDRCQYGYTRGTLGWHLGPLVRPRTVDVKASIVDRPLPAQPVTICGDDGRFTVVTMTAYARDVAVDTELVRADNGIREITFPLVNETSVAPIDRIVVQVCRHPRVSGPAVYCGARQEYRAPVN